MPEIETNLGELRRKRGLSAIHLAAAIGVSRQTIYAMEAGTYVPNTAVALRLARAPRYHRRGLVFAGRQCSRAKSALGASHSFARFRDPSNGSGR